jgi:hypothetical protein
LAIGADPPVDDLGFVDVIALVVGCGQAGCVVNGTINIDYLPTRPADEVVMVVGDPILEPGGRTCRLEPADQALVGQDPKSVVNSLAGNRTNLCAYRFGNIVGRAVGSSRHGIENCEALGGDLEAVLAEEVCWFDGRRHDHILNQILDSVKNRRCGD